MNVELNTRGVQAPDNLYTDDPLQDRILAEVTARMKYTQTGPWVLPAVCVYFYKRNLILNFGWWFRTTGTTTVGPTAHSIYVLS